MSDDLISERYRALQAGLHAANPDYGIASVSFAPLVADLMRQNGIVRLLDYGAGKGRLEQSLRRLLATPFTVVPYEPAIADWAAAPTPEDFVCCIDVLEHVEPEHLDAVLDDLARVTRRVGFFTVHTGAATKSLPDGRNAHLIQEPAEWWLPRLMSRFELYSFARTEMGFHVIVGPRSARGR